MSQIAQPEATKVTTEHTITYKGTTITIKGWHEYKYSTVSKMKFGFWAGNEGIVYGLKSTLTLREKLDNLIDTITKSKARRAVQVAFMESYKSLSTEQKIAHENFAYSRFKESGLGNYYNLYWKSPTSPTGVELVGGCSESEWEEFSTKTNNSHNYLVGNEKW